MTRKQERYIQIAISMPRPMLDRLADVTRETGVSQSEAMRVAFTRYYTEIFRAETYGYQAGSKAGSRKDKKLSIDQQLNQFENLESSQIIPYLDKVGFFTPEQKAQYTMAVEVEMGENELMLVLDSVDETVSLPMSEVLIQLKKHLKSLK